MKGVTLSDKLEEAQSLLSKRLEELDRERAQLAKALDQLEGLSSKRSPGSPAAGKPAKARAAEPRAAKRSSSRSNGSASNGSASNGSSRSSGSKRRSSSKRAPRGEREKQLLLSIKSNPDYRVSDHAREVGVSPQQLYPLLSRLVEKDAIVKDDRTYAVKA